MRYLAKQLSSWMMVLFLGSMIFASCKKADNPNPNPPGGGNGTGLSDEDSLKLYVYGYMQKSIFYPDSTYDIPIYLWYSQVPALNPLSTQYDSAEDLLNAIISYPQNPTDRYSFLDRTGAVSGEIEGGVQGDFGINISYAADANNNTYLYILYAYKNSSAGLQGVQRGWEITAINGNTNVSYDGTGYGDGTFKNVDMVDNALGAASSQFTFKKPDGSSVTLTLDASVYALNPVLFDTVYNVGSKKAGYFVFNTFVSVYDSAGNPSETKNELDNAFSQFKSAGINDLIVDLRYNGGGAVETAEYIDSLIAPASAAGKPMYTYSYNDKVTQYEGPDALDLPTTVNYPTPTGGLTLDHVFFIVDRNTVSASELTLNNLKPYMDVKLIGDTTYGKPAGFFTFPIVLWDTVTHQFDKYLADLYPISFHTVNASGNGDYYQGIPADVEAYDYIDLNWGDTSDARLQEAFKYINDGSFRLSNARMALSANMRRGIEKITRRSGFQGMINFKAAKAIKKELTPFMRKKAG